jgi:hypothetical protein
METAAISSWEQQLSTMDAEWRAVERFSESSKVQRWSQEFDRLQQTARKARAAGLWRVGPDHLLGVIGRDRDELTHSRLLGWLLDPAGQHGIGVGLLSLLMSEVFGTDAPGDAHVQVTLELSTPAARADIVADWGTNRVVIENKIDAIEQPRQCERLAEDHPGANLLFLSPNGAPPVTAGGSLGEWRCLSWRRMRLLIEKAAEQAVLAPDRPVTNEYISSLGRLFP